MNEHARCPDCGAELSAGAPQALCPACLLKRGLGTQTGDQSGAGAQADDFIPPTPAELAVHFPDLEILQFIGRGGMGMVYQARQKRLDRQVALKILLPSIARDEAFAERFAREARAMAMLSHPNIVAVYDFGQTSAPQTGAGSPAGADGPLYYFLMEYVEGATLREVLESGKLAPSEALAIVPQICEALQYAHDNGVVHRDIKPANILMDTRGRVKIADFGLAKLLGRLSQSGSLTGTGQVMGTPHYMAPEQIEHPQEVDHRADIYSLGVVFYQMLTGELPIGRFAPPSKKVLVDVRLDHVVLRTLEHEPELRYQRAGEVKTEIETIATTPPVVAPRSASPIDAAAIEQARGQVRGPAIGLLVSGIVNWIVTPLIILVIAWSVSTTASPSKAYDRSTLTPQEAFQSQLPLLAVPLAILVISSLMIFAALKMKRLQAYGLAISASILAIIVSPGNLIGLPIGIWALVVLSQADVRAAFQKNRLGRTGSGGLRSPSQSPDVGRIWPLVLFLAPPAVFVWFLLAGHLLFQVDLDADEQFYVGFIGLPLCAGVSALLTWAARTILAPVSPTPDEAEPANRRWSWLAIASAIVLGISLLPGGGAMVVIPLLGRELLRRDWHPSMSELAMTLSILGGTVLLAGSATLLAIEAVRRMRRGQERLRGRGLAIAIGWFWPAMVVALALAAVTLRVQAPFAKASVAARMEAEREREMAERKTALAKRKTEAAKTGSAAAERTPPPAISIESSGTALVGKGSQGDRFVLRVGFEDALSCRFVNDTQFTALLERDDSAKDGGGLTCQVFDSNRKELLSVTNTKVGPMKTGHGRLVFQGGLSLVSYDVMMIVGEFRPESGAPVPLTAHVERAGSLPSAIAALPGTAAKPPEKRSSVDAPKPKAGPSAARPNPSRDQVIVEDLAIAMLAAMRDKDDAALRKLAADSVPAWRDALPQFALEIRERVLHKTGKPLSLWPVESLVEGDLAVVKCTGPKEFEGMYLALFFVKTDQGWRNWLLRNASPSKPLGDFLKEKPPADGKRDSKAK